jgi:hypothetical protein
MKLSWKMLADEFGHFVRVEILEREKRLESRPTPNAVVESSSQPRRTRRARERGEGG